jgi:acyl-coenzyme A synthetase/AMP-(fatty) acid ligase
MIMSGAERVHSAGVENVLALQLAVTGCPVIGARDDHRGERFQALVVLVPETGATSGKLQQPCRRPVSGHRAPPKVPGWRRPW